MSPHWAAKHLKEGAIFLLNLDPWSQQFCAAGKNIPGCNVASVP